MPWASDPASKDNMSYLVDILCDIPGLRNDSMNLRNSELEPDQQVAFHQAFVRNLLDHMNQLYEWRARWEEENPTCCNEVPAVEYLDQQPLFPTMFSFSSLRRADEILVYNVILINLVILFKLDAKGICPPFSASLLALHLPPIARHGPLQLPGEAKDIQAMATEICKCVGYYLSDHRNRTSFYLLVSLRVAYIAFPRTSTQAKWVDKKMARVADLNGFEIVKNCGPGWL